MFSTEAVSPPKFPVGNFLNLQTMNPQIHHLSTPSLSGFNDEGSFYSGPALWHHPFPGVEEAHSLLLDSAEKATERNDCVV